MFFKLIVRFLLTLCQRDVLIQLHDNFLISSLWCCRTKLYNITQVLLLLCPPPVQYVAPKSLSTITAAVF